jgi:hypothetical protein
MHVVNAISLERFLKHFGAKYILKVFPKYTSKNNSPK